MSDINIGYIEGLPNMDILTTEGTSYINPAKFQYMILERLDDICFDNFNVNEDFTRWEKGRLFGQHYELKWKQRSNGFHVVVMSETDIPDGFQLYQFESIEFWGNRSVFLWGELQQPAGNTYYESVIPKILTYPKHSHRLAITIQEYRSIEQDNINTIHCYTGVEER
ncbi:hypothetical protein H8E88_12260 [candidate division KSB1 bacterium]|nr:hypothetical protein [candidate division KSB1 bacterium]